MSLFWQRNETMPLFFFFFLFFISLAGFAEPIPAGNPDERVDAEPGADALKREPELLQRALLDARKKLRQQAAVVENLTAVMVENNRLRVEIQARDGQIDDLRRQMEKLETAAGVTELKKRLQAEIDLLFVMDNGADKTHESNETTALLKRNQKLQRQLEWFKNMRDPKMRDTAKLLRERGELIEQINRLRQSNEKHMSDLNKLRAKTDAQKNALASQNKELRLLRAENKLLQDALKEKLTPPSK